MFCVRGRGVLPSGMEFMPQILNPQDVTSRFGTVPLCRHHSSRLSVACCLFPAFLLLVVTALHAQDFSYPDTEPAPQAALIQKANDALAAGDFHAALAVLTSLNLQTPNNPEILYDLGMTLEALEPDSPTASNPCAAAPADSAPPSKPASAAEPLLPQSHRRGTRLPCGACRAWPAAGPDRPLRRSPHPTCSRHHAPRRQRASEGSCVPCPGPTRPAIHAAQSRRRHQ